MYKIEKFGENFFVFWEICLIDGMVLRFDDVGILMFKRILKIF